MLRGGASIQIFIEQLFAESAFQQQLLIDNSVHSFRAWGRCRCGGRLNGSRSDEKKFLWSRYSSNLTPLEDLKKGISAHWHSLRMKRAKKLVYSGLCG